MKKDDDGTMANPIILLEKTNKNADDIFRLFMENREILLKRLRAKISKSSLYRLFYSRIDQINDVLKTINPSLFFIDRKQVKSNSRILISYYLHPSCVINETDEFFFLEFNPQVDDTKDNIISGRQP